MSSFAQVLDSGALPKLRIPRYPVVLTSELVGFFDGVEQNGLCGVGMVIQMECNNAFWICMNVGMGSNTRAELLALWGLLYFAKFWDIGLHMVLGDLKAIIYWVHNAH